MDTLLEEWLDKNMTCLPQWTVVHATSEIQITTGWSPLFLCHRGLAVFSLSVVMLVLMLVTVHSIQCAPYAITQYTCM